MAYQQDMRAELYTGSWQDISAYVYQRDQVHLTRGRQNEASTMQPCSATLTLNNRDGRFTTRNPVGAYYPGLVQNSPLRLSVKAADAGLSNYLRLEPDTTSSASTPDSSTLATPALAQPAVHNAAALSSVTVTLGSPTTAGNLLVVCFAGDGTTTSPVVSGVTLGGAAGNFALVKASSTNESCSIWADPNCAGGQTSVVVSTSGGAGTLSVEATVYEFSGAAVSVPDTDQTSSAGSPATSSFSSGSTPATTQANDLAVGAVAAFHATTAPTITGPGAPWTNVAGTTVSTLSQLSGYQVVTSAGSTPAYSGGLTAGTDYDACIATFKAKLTAGPLAITGPIDVRVDLWPSDYNGNVLAAKWGGSGKSWLFTLDALNWNHPFGNTPLNGEQVATGTLGWYWFDGVNTQFLRASVPLPYYGQRVALRCQFTPSTGVAIFYTAPTMAGSWTQLGAAQTFGATTLSAGAGQAVQVGGGPVSPWPVAQDQAQLTFSSALGMIYEAQILSNVTLEADPVFSSQTAGAGSFADAQSNTWTLNGTAAITDRLFRFHGEMGAYPKTVDPSGQDVHSQASAFGQSKRMQNSNTPGYSPMRRAYLRLPASLNLGAYWTCEDGNGSTSLGSALGGPPMTISSGPPSLASNSDFLCSSALPVMNGAYFYGLVPQGYTVQDAAVRFLWEVPAAGETTGATIAQIFYTGGAVGYVTLVYTTGGFLNMSAYSPAGALLHSTGAVSFGINGQKLRVAVDLKKNGSNIDMTIATLAVGASSAGIFTASAFTSGTVPSVYAVEIGGGGVPVTTSVFGHVSVQGVADSLFDVAGALNAWTGEPAAARFARICGEEGIACRIVGSPAASMPMTVQTTDSVFNLLQSCEYTDLGMIFEPRTCLGLGYRTRSSMYHQTPLCTASYSAAQLFQGFASTGDTQLAVNDVTAQAPDGSTARQVLSSGAMSVLAPPNGISRVDTQIQPSPQFDSTLNQIASWYLSTRSVDDDRYPVIPFEMARTETPVSAALLDVGDYLQITGTPAWLPPGPIRQIVAGTQETLFPGSVWTLEANCFPEAPYETAQVSIMHLDTAGAQLTSSVTSVAASFQVTTTAGPVWTQAGGDFPFDIICDGERMTVTAISSATSPQTFTVTRSVNGVVKAHSAGAAVSLFSKPILAL